jgi:hypothetical protein
VTVDAQGVEVPVDWGDVRSGENYVGYDRTENFASLGGAVLGEHHVYAAPTQLFPNDWALSGAWTIEHQFVRLTRPMGGSSIAFTPAICIWSWDQQRQEHPCGFAYSLMGSRQVRLTEAMLTSRATAQ